MALMKSRKGMGMALTLVVTAVVLIVISLVIITMVTGGLSKFGASNNQQMEDASESTTSAIAIAHCNAQKAVGNETCCVASYADISCDKILHTGTTTWAVGTSCVSGDVTGCN